MKRNLISLSALLLAILLCACASPTETDDPETPTDEPAILNETSGITGVRTGSSIRYEDFGLTVTIPEGAVMNWDSDEQPASFSQLDAEIETEGAAAGYWTDFETPEGPALVGKGSRSRIAVFGGHLRERVLY